jgi:A/G-specific adenine glycosylase
MTKIEAKSHFTDSLLSWFDADPARRPMPWKGEKDPYRIWLSEIILQQTRVEQGWAYFERFVKAFPRVADLSSATEDEVLAMWKGLGYYSRARNLHQTAKHVHSVLNGEFPKTKAELKKLKGVGDYTASAIASFAFEEPAAVLDGNVIRILCRYFGIEEEISQSSTRKRLESLVDDLLPKTRPADFNQAAMDFGALICSPKKPLCFACPVKNQCVAFEKGIVEKLPIKKTAKAKRERYFHFLVLQPSPNSVWMEKRTRNDIWKNLWQLPMFESDKLLVPRALKQELCDHWPELDLEKELEIYPKAYKQQLSHQIIHARFYKSSTLIKQGPADTDWKEVAIENLDTFALPKVVDCFFIDDWLN